MKFDLRGRLPYACEWIYFHGEAEKLMMDTYGLAHEAPDLVSCDTPLNAVDLGIHNGTLLGKPVRFYFWAKRPISRGLVILSEDAEAMEYALKRYNQEAQHL